MMRDGPATIAERWGSIASVALYYPIGIVLRVLPRRAVASSAMRGMVA